MEKAIWKGKEVFAFEVSKNYNAEKAIRQASGKKELFCPDENCKHRVLKYCHGDKKQPYFSHITNTNCEYEKYDNETTEYTKAVKKLLYSHLKNQGYNVEMDVKLVEKHYSHLVITENGMSFPIEIITKFSSANRLDFIKKKYNENHLKVNWIVTDIFPENDNCIVESELNFSKRFSLNETDNNTLITIDLSGDNVIQYCMDTKNYIFDGREIKSENYPKIFKLTSNISNLKFSNGELHIVGFFDAFNEFVTKKNRAFSKKVFELKEQKEREKIEIQKRIEEAQRIAKINNEKHLKEKQLEAQLRKKEEKPLKKIEKNHLNCLKLKEYSLENIQSVLISTSLAPYELENKDTMVIWDKSNFEKAFHEILTQPEVRFKMIVNKLRYGTPNEREIFKKLYYERTVYDKRIIATLEMIYKQVESDIGVF